MPLHDAAISEKVGGADYDASGKQELAGFGDEVEDELDVSSYQCKVANACSREVFCALILCTVLCYLLAF
ncbi:hypothetical protein KDH_11710 [Dictyobacter sp. S3.2.2.5]|uniref:Uncharacterized protein n=1 Tax=Dictyobacter halimunensis TaxID=3026934 RepID=A0ABQ6FKU9_9CHLR|nr:hypothetical protein KDH_11710 [Dictyobacter sp. S3.2.2.5]